jgi:hypothetical protein
MKKKDVLDEKVLFETPAYKRIRRWLKGIHPGRGQVFYGYTGWETIEETDVYKLHFIRVIDLTPFMVEFEEIEEDNI